MSNLNNNTGIIAQEIGNVELGDITITSITSPSTVTIDLSNFSSGNMTMQNVSYSSIDTITITDGSGTSFTGPSWQWIESVPFETGFPEWDDFQAMCKEYPGLEKTFEHLKVFYKLCKDEWETKKKGEL